MAKFITIMSGKGGAGKTTSTINLAHAMTKIGVDTIILDGNLSAPNLSIHLGSTYFPITIHDVMQENSHIKHAIYQHPSGIKIIPADVSVDAMKFVNFEKLKKYAQDLHLLTDYVLVDGSPGLGRESTQLLSFADEVLIVTNPDMPSLLDAKRLIEFSKKFNKTIAGLIVTKIKNKRHQIREEEIEKFLGLPILAKIPHDERFEKALHKKMPYIHLFPRRKAAREYMDLAKRLTGKVHL